MADLFVLAFLGHLVGDFLLQPKWMALEKSSRSWRGDFACTAHVAIYTAVVCTFMGSANLWVAALIAIPHWIIDRWSLASTWLWFIGGRTFAAAKASEDGNREFDVAFTCIVYTFTDSALHFLSLWAVIQYVMV
ncbi:hypothetical protein A2765_02820 [Candidatus Kaiserbacteria bacterium RIFCSPHIGHO2_01_FULL_56_24]|uniref:DUF3307 domain-containing protein n=1 Tax=Candidatus Kaiserbacteria bacterium RIFCSPHIGHO2_01_FULL_56_24 TaxID=1798487 RepID=A0A1F6DB99_9BACT|nr:MAG: hypothetical protein A2765_02820 [Candidatus Kaiserbacteria bacterium RIFCSPHIGHO2_01_FULL_56_24]